MGKENFWDFINPQEEKEITDEAIGDYANEGMEKLEQFVKTREGRATETNFFRGFAGSLLEEVKKDPDIVSHNSYYANIWEQIKERAENHPNIDIRDEAQRYMRKYREIIEEAR